jgi:AcrR family transcriptional regulator
MVAGRYHHGDLANALLDATATVIADEGIARLSLRAVARRVGVSPSAAYHHFPDRAALLDALAVRELDALADLVERAIATEPGLTATDRIVKLACAYVRWARADPERFELVFGGARAHPGSQTNPRPYALLEALLDDAVARQELSPASRSGAGELLWPAMHGVAVLTSAGPLRGRSQASILSRTERLMRTILAGLRA